jgi:hypothetical protein
MAAPTVTAVSPASGVASGNTAVLITGTNFTAATAVIFGGIAALGYTVQSATQITATSPPHTAGAVQVAVTNADGTSSNTSADDYTYTATSTLFSVAEARAYNKATLTSATTYPDATIIAKEAAIRARFERIIGVALTSTTSTEYYDGDGSNTLELRHHMPWADPTPSAVTVTSITVIATDDTETAFTADELSDVVKYPGELTRRSGTFTRGVRNIKVVYTHGYTTCPDDIKNAALQALLLPPPDGIVPSLRPSDAIDGQEGTTNWSKVKDPTRGRWFGSEAIDPILRYHRDLETMPGIA